MKNVEKDEKAKQKKKKSNNKQKNKTKMSLMESRKRGVSFTHGFETPRGT